MIYELLTQKAQDRPPNVFKVNGHSDLNQYIGDIIAIIASHWRDSKSLRFIYGLLHCSIIY